MKNLSIRAYVAGVVVATAIIGGAGLAGATPPTTAEQVEEMAIDSAAELLPIVLAVGGAFAGLAAAVFGVRWVLRAVRNGGRA